MAQAVTIPPPPRLSGDARVDGPARTEWEWLFYQAAIVSGGVLQPSDLPELLKADFPTLYALGVLPGTVANRVAYFTGPNTLALTTLTAFARSLLDDETQANAQTTLGVSPYSDEQAQDAVGSILTDTAEIDFTYDDGGNLITADLKTDSVVVGRVHLTATDKLLGRSTAGAGGGEEIVCTAAGRALLDDPDAAAQQATLGLASGRYTPTCTAVANVDALTAHPAFYSRVGNVVTVTGRVDVDATTTATTTSVGISLPVASNFAASTDLAGVSGTSADGAGSSGYLSADTVNDRATLEFKPVGTSNTARFYAFSYEVI